MLEELKASAAGNVMSGVRDVNETELRETICSIIDRINDNTLSDADKKYKVPVVFGAIGIGKTKIIKSIVDAINEDKVDDKDKMSVVHINCAALKAGEFFMPIEGGSKFAVPSWLPVYNTTGDKKAQKIGNTIANMGSFEEKDGFSITTGGGGILFFDGILRTNPSVFTELMTFLRDGRFHNYKLGSKWIMVAADNRPSDDKECSEVIAAEFCKNDNFEPINYVPDVESWLKWAEKAGVNEYIRDYIKEFPDMLYKPYDGDSFIFGANPRNWTLLSKEFDNQVRGKKFQKFDPRFAGKENNVKNIKELSTNALMKICNGYVGSKVAEKFVSWLCKIDK